MFWLSPTYWQMFLRLVVATVLGGVVGFERAEKNHDAGLRTHILVSLGSAAVMVMSELVCQQFPHTGIDVTRMGAQVISGIGFLGAGCIITTGNKAMGLTTAAGLWATSCVGLLVGIGYYSYAVTVVALMLFAMLGLRPLADRLHAKSYDVTIRFAAGDQSSLLELLRFLSSLGMEIHSLKVSAREPDAACLTLKTQGRSKLTRQEFLEKASLLEGVKEISFT